jgi:hypothetical protein
MVDAAMRKVSRLLHGRTITSTSPSLMMESSGRVAFPGTRQKKKRRIFDPNVRCQNQPHYLGFIEFVNAAGTGGWIIPSDLVTDEMRKALEEMGYVEEDRCCAADPLPAFRLI